MRLLPLLATVIGVALAETVCVTEGSIEHACYSLPFTSTYWANSERHACFVFMDDASIDRSRAEASCQNLQAKFDSSQFMSNPWLHDKRTKFTLAKVDDAKQWMDVQKGLLIPQNGYSLVDRAGLFTSGQAIPASEKKETQTGYLCRLENPELYMACDTDALGGRRYRDKCYYLIDTNTADAAEKLCKMEKGGNLAIITDDEMNQYMASEARAEKSAYKGEARMIVGGFYNSASGRWEVSRKSAHPLRYYRWWLNSGKSATADGDSSRKPIVTVHFSTNNNGREAKFGYWENVEESAQYYALCEAK